MSHLWYRTIWNSKMKMKIREFPYLCIAQWIGSVIFNFQQNLVNFGNEVRNKMFMFSPRLMLMVSNKCFQIRLFIKVLAGLLVTKCNPHYMLWSPWRWLCWLRWWRWAGQQQPHPSTSGAEWTRRHPSYCPGHCSYAVNTYFAFILKADCIISWQHKLSHSLRWIELKPFFQ